MISLLLLLAGFAAVIVVAIVLFGVAVGTVVAC